MLRSFHHKYAGLSAIATLLLLSGCNRDRGGGAPPRAHDTVKIKPQASFITVPIRADLEGLAKALDREMPTTLWRIDKPDQTCAPSRKVDIGITKIKTPTIKCRIVGEVTRGPLRFAGEGEQILLTMPIHAVIHARDIAGILQQETATADATAHAVISVKLASDWTPRGTVRISYDWTNNPHVEFLGQRIDLTEHAERKLEPVVARLERQLPGQLGRLEVREQVQKAWASAFTTLSLNRDNPPVWMRISPKQVQYGGYEIDGQNLVLRLGLKAITETFVGKRPTDPAPSPLPLLKPLETQAGRLSFFIPVVADYRELEPILMKALRKRSVRPFEVPGVGPVNAEFRNAIIYGTTGGRIAVGVNFIARDAANRLGPTHGTVWMTGIPTNDTNSRRIGFDQFEVSGTTDMKGGDLILRMANAPGLDATIAASLAQNFEDDYRKLLDKIDRALEDKREGDLMISAEVTRTRTGQIRAAGRGLFLPVWAEGTASIRVAPQLR